MLRVILVDDEPPARRGLAYLLAAHPDAEIVGAAESLAEAAALCARTSPDLVFLDVTLTDGEGFDLLSTLRPMPLVVLVTASAAHAIRAFEVGALDFLLKPVEPERLALTMDRVRGLRGDPAAPRPVTAVPGPVPPPAPDPAPDSPGRLVISEGSATVIVTHAEIGLLTADADFTRIRLVDRREHLVCRRLGQFEDQLPSPPFVRLGRSLIANLGRIERIEARGGGGALLRLKGLDAPVALGRAATRRLRKAVELLP